MSVYARAKHIVVRTLAIAVGAAVVAFAILVLVRLMAHTTQPAEAASVIYYPNFCLGGWKYPQHASGPAAVTGDFDPEKFNVQNSAYLESSIASQLFCGYFSIRNAKNPPTKAVISFNWLLAFKDSTPNHRDADSYTSTSSNPTGISPETGFIPTTSTAPVLSPQTVSPVTSTSTGSTTGSGGSNAAAVGDAPVTHTPATDSGPSTTTEIPVVPPASSTGSEHAGGASNSDNSAGTAGTSGTSDANQTPASSSSTGGDTPSGSNSDSSPVSATPSSGDTAPASAPVPPPPPPEPTPAPAPAPAPDPTPAPAPSSDAPQSFNTQHNLGSLISSLLVSKVHAAETDDVVVQSPISANSFKDYLEVSYSLDGIRWTAIGRVNKDNWKDYKVEIPVTSWDEVKRLQIMVSVLPTIDEKPDIYLDSMSMRAEYKQTVTELAAEGLAAVSNAVDGLIGDGNGAENTYDIVADAPAPPHTTEVRTKKLMFPTIGTPISIMHTTFDEEGRAKGKISSKKINVSTSGGGSSLEISGTCDKKYFVILTYRNLEDYIKKPRSFVVNRADECVQGKFAFDMATLSPETRGGAQYLVVGEQGEEGTWDVVSDLFPIDIVATTTVEIITQ